MNSREAKELSDSNQIKFEERREKHLNHDLKQIYSSIKNRSKRGYYDYYWVYNNCLDRNHIKEILEIEGYSVNESYPFLIISWIDVETSITKK